MTELLDAFSDEGLDSETAGFLVEALANAEEADWPDIIEPFAPPDRALAVLSSVPGVLDRTVAWLACEEDRRQEVMNCASRFLDALAFAMLAHSSGFCLARWSRLCRSARKSTARREVWEHRARVVISLCGVRPPAGKLVDWRAEFFRHLRPRLDGIYVGECGYDHFIPYGSSTDLRKNAKEFNWMKGAKGSGLDVRYDYRRYVRFFPPGEDGALRAIVVQDAGPRDDLLTMLHGMDPVSHVNPQKQEAIRHEAKEISHSKKEEVANMQSRACAGRYKVCAERSRVEVEYATGDGIYHLEFNILHGQPSQFCTQLEWQNYVLINTGGEELPFHLGRKLYKDGSRVEGSPPGDEKSDHFPSMDLIPSVHLECFL